MLFQNCNNCGHTVTDKKLLQLLEVYPVKCPCCGKIIAPLKVCDDDIYVTIEDIDDDGNIIGSPVKLSQDDVEKSYETISDDVPAGFEDTLHIGGM